MSAQPKAPLAVYRRAERLRSMGLLENARRLYRRFVENPVAGKSPFLYIESCLALAALCRGLGETGEARSWIARGAACSRRERLDGFQERLGLEKAMVLRAEGKFPESLRRLSRFLRRFKGRRDWEGAAFVLWAMGGARRFSGDLAGAGRDFRNSLSLARRTRDKAGVAYAMLGLGGLSRIQGRLRDSERYYGGARELLDGTPDIFGRAYAECGLANALRQAGRLGEARRGYIKARRLYSRLDDPLDRAFVDWGLGRIAMFKGDPASAERLFLGALGAFSRATESRGVVLARKALSEAQHALGKKREAEKNFEEAVRLSRRSGLSAHLEFYV